MVMMVIVASLVTGSGDWQAVWMGRPVALQNGMKNTPFAGC
jgi:hypothetical protein